MELKSTQIFFLITTLIITSLLVSCTLDQKIPPPIEPVDEPVKNQVYFDNISIQKNIVYGIDDPNQQVMDAYLQSHSMGEPKWVVQDSIPRPTLIYIHGGGWLGGDKAENPYQFSDFLQRGWNVFSLNYRMGPGTAPDAAEDVICAMRYIVDRAETYNIDINEIFTMGASAGGHLSLVTGLAPTSGRSFRCDVKDVSIKGIINYFGITDIAKNDAVLKSYGDIKNYTITWVGDMSRMDKISNNYSPVHWITSDAPPIITIHGTVDRVVPYEQGKMIAAKAKELGVKHEMVTIDNGNHGGFGDDGWDKAHYAVWEFVGDIRGFMD